MKQFTFLVILLPIFNQSLQAQCSASISASGPTSFCTGGSVVLSATPSLGLQKANLGGGARGLAVSFYIGTKGYLGTGYDRAFKKDIWEYDPTANTWTQKADFGGTARGYAASFSIGSKGYVGTGNDGSNNQNDFWEYNPATNVWTPKANFGGVARQFATAFCIGGKGYIGTGLDANGNYLNDFWEYEPVANNWTKKADYAGGGRYSAAGFCLGTKGYVGTGVGALGNNTKDFYEFDPVGNTWTQKADFGGSERFGCVAFVLGSKGFIGSGYNHSLNKDFWEYDPTSNAWTRRADFEGTAREFATAFSTGSKAFIATGIDKFGFKADLWEYNPSTTYLWSNNETTPEITVTTSGTYSVTITNSTLGCSATSLPTVVKVNTATTADTTATVCNSFTWHGVTYYNTGDKIYTTTNVAGCDSTITLHLTISVLSTTFSKTNSGCYGSSTGSITVNATSGVSPFKYRLGTVGPINSANNTFSNLKAGSYRAYVQDATGCIGVAAPIVVSQAPKITATITPTAVTGCYGSANGKLSISNPSGNAPFKYKLGTNGSYTSFTPPYSITGLKAGNYIIYIQDASSCTASTGVTTVAQPAQVAVSFTKTDISCTTPTASLTLSSPGNANATFKINPGSNVYSTKTTYSGLVAGTYYCYAKDSNGCAGRTGPIVFAPATGCGSILAKTPFASLQVENEYLEISLWPNPSSSFFRLIVHSANMQPVYVRVIDANGRSVYETKGQPEQSFMFGDKLLNGLYLIEVKQGKEVKTLKAIKVK